MSTLTRETKEATTGVTAPSSSQAISGGGGGGVGSGTRAPVAGLANDANGRESSQTNEMENINSGATPTASSQQTTNSNNTISAAADSSDNQPGTPQPAHHHQQNSNAIALPHAYANHPMYGVTQTPVTSGTAPAAHLNQMYVQHAIYSPSTMDLAPQQQLQHPSLHPSAQHSTYTSYINSYEQFYQQQLQSQVQHNQQMEFINSISNPLYNSSPDVKPPARYHPYLHAPLTGVSALNLQNSQNAGNAVSEANAQPAPLVVSSVSSSVMSPRVVSSTSPSSSSNQLQIGGGSVSSIGSISAGNSSSPNSAGSSQCKTCGVMCVNETELQEHITNVHAASPYGSSGYSSSPYIKEELQQPQQQQQTPPMPGQHTQQPIGEPAIAAQSSNNGEILDLDSQKLLYPPGNMMHPPLSNGGNDPLHGLHSMQQRAGMNSWDQHSQDGMPTYLQQQHQQQSATESKNLPSYHLAKTEYQPIKTEYMDDTQQFMNSNPAEHQQQQIISSVVPSSPAEFPSTTTGGPQENGQQFRGTNFEPPSSSSTTANSDSSSTKSGAWKTNEPRRAKSYQCTACNKWFTSSGHLKRHYNTTLHKNAVKSSGQPDPATFPISNFHHPEKDVNNKPSKRGTNKQQKQLPPIPVQPPEPPNSPQNYAAAPQMTPGGGGLTHLTHYAATPSPNSMYQQQQQQHYQQHQYVPQVPSTISVSPQQASSMANQHLQQQQQNQQQTVINGHPNALAGPSVLATQQQMPMPSSQMRGLLNVKATNATITLLKNQLLEAANRKEEQMVGEAEAAAVMKEVIYHKKMEMKKLSQHNMSTQKVEVVPVQQHEEEVLNQMQPEGQVREVPKALHHHNITQLPTIHQIQIQEPQLVQEAIHTNNHNNTPQHSPLIISQEICQPLMLDQEPYTLTQIQSPTNIMEEHHCISTLLDISMQQLPNNTLQLPQQYIITELPPVTTIPTINTANHPHHHHTHTDNMPLQPVTISTNTPLELITTSKIPNMQSCHQLELVDTVVPQQEHTQICPPTIIGNINGNGSSANTSLEATASATNTFNFCESDARISSTTPSPFFSSPDYNSISTYYNSPESLAASSRSSPVSCSYSPHSEHISTEEQQQQQQQQPTISKKRKHAEIDPSKLDANTTEILPNGRIKCLPCNKDFSKMCYLTQHNNSIHSGELPYRCQKCGKNFKSEDIYNKHVATHLDMNKQYKCPMPECMKMYTHKPDLRRHIDTVHHKKNQYFCDTCMKSFPRNDHLRKHEQTHGRRTRKPTANAKANNKISKEISFSVVYTPPSSAPTTPSRNVSQHTNVANEEVNEMNEVVPASNASCTFIFNSNDYVDANVNNNYYYEICEAHFIPDNVATQQNHIEFALAEEQEEDRYLNKDSF